MSVGVHLQFTGQCREAFEFYQAILGGSLEVISYGSTPAGEQVPEDWQDKVVHATLKIDELELAGADIQPEQYQKPTGFQLLIQAEDEERSKQLFDALGEGGSITIPLQQTFWSPCYGMLIDKFGIPWEVNCNSSDQV